MGENIQHLSCNSFHKENCILKNCKFYSIKNSIIIEGENDVSDLVLKDCNLLFVLDDEMKNISFEISD